MHHDEMSMLNFLDTAHSRMHLQSYLDIRTQESSPFLFTSKCSEPTASSFPPCLLYPYVIRSPTKSSLLSVSDIKTF